MMIRPPPFFSKVYFLYPALDEAPILADDEQHGRAGLAANVEQHNLPGERYKLNTKLVVCKKG